MPGDQYHAVALCCAGARDACGECHGFVVDMAQYRSRVAIYVLRRLRHQADVDDVGRTATG